MPLRILFYEPDHTGHHFAYLARMLPGFLALDDLQVIVATTRQALESEEFSHTLGKLGDRVRMEAACSQPPEGALAIARHRVAELAKLIKRLKPDHVCVMYADGLWQVMAGQALVGRRVAKAGVTIEGWIYRGQFAMSPWDTFGNRVRRVMFRSLLRRGVFDRLHIDHELLYDKASRWAARSRSKTELVLTPNPILLADPMNKADARRELGLPVSGRLVTTTGMIASWKGVDRLLAAFLQFTEGSGSKVDDRLLLGGPHSDEIREILGQPAYRALVERGQIVSIDRFLNEQQMFTCAAAGDLTAAVYPHPSGRSSIILWAAAAGRPSLGTDAGCIGYVIRQQRLGLTAESLAPQPLARQIEQALAMPWTDDDVARVRQYASTHSVENYQRVACDFVRRRLGVNAPVT